jgi:hypothetical protein
MAKTFHNLNNFGILKRWEMLDNDTKELQYLKMELLARGRDDVIFFSEYFLGLNLNAFQKRYLRSWHKQILCVCGNQVGKTVAISIKHIHRNFYKIYLDGEPEAIEQAEYKTLNLSPVSRQAKKAFQYVVEILTSSFTWITEGKRYINECKIGWFLLEEREYMGKINFANNSALDCVSTHQDKGASIQGEQFGLITYDEAPQSHHLKDELDARIFSRVSRLSGSVDLIGTPDQEAKSQQYWFNIYTAANKALIEGRQGEWQLFKGYYDDNIFIPKEKRDEYKKRIKIRNPLAYEQIVLGNFTVASNRMFSPQMVQGFWNDNKKETPVKEENRYVIVVDWGVADQGDKTVMKVCDYTDQDNVEIVKHYSKKGGDPTELIAMLQFLHFEYNDARIVHDASALGGAVFKKLIHHMTPISFPQTEKSNALTYLQIRFRNNLKGAAELKKNEKYGIGRLRSYYIADDESELSAYQIDDKKLEQDNVIVLAQLCWFLDKYIKANQVKTFKLIFRGGPPTPISRDLRQSSRRRQYF